MKNPELSTFPAKAALNSVLRLCAVAAFLLTPLCTFSHHTLQAKFDVDKPVTLSGLVTGVSWENPHVHIFINAGGEGTAPVNWAIELDSPVELELSGWRPADLSPGDRITIDGIAALDNSEQAWAFRVRRHRDDRFIYTLDERVQENRLARQQPGTTPRWPDGHPRLGPPPGATGYWSIPSATGLVQQGEVVAMDANGLLIDLEDADRVAPFQDWARDLFVLRQRNYLKDDPQFLYCMPPGGPRHFQMPHPFGLQFVEDPERDRVFILTGGGNNNWRLVYSAGRDNLDQVTVNPNDPLFYGTSVAEWEGDILVIDSWNFNDGFWFSNGGMPHSPLLRLTERISRPDLNTLHYEVTINDPGAYTRSWTSSWDLQWIPGEELPEYFCQGNRP